MVNTHCVPSECLLRPAGIGSHKVYLHTSSRIKEFVSDEYKEYGILGCCMLSYTKYWPDSFPHYLEVWIMDERRVEEYTGNGGENAKH